MLENEHGIAIDEDALQRVVREFRLGRQEVEPPDGARESLSEIETSKELLASHLGENRVLEAKVLKALVKSLDVITWFASLTARQQIASADAQKKTVAARNLGRRFRGYTPAVNDFILTEVTRLRIASSDLSERAACRYVGGYLALEEVVPPGSYEANVLKRYRVERDRARFKPERHPEVLPGAFEDQILAEKAVAKVRLETRGGVYEPFTTLLPADRQELLKAITTLAKFRRWFRRRKPAS